ncbi:hypothetical protein SteCoe_5809 [Stentor coeruleus]|uniref:Uncharacterized protein n=1 Tax=Stentor coeruleus TaxID=5963 RepID=A0A1R2CRD1_9CILI|nr:hypothetical protein SteCoe_5809 [Stentor coeruleus]
MEEQRKFKLLKSKLEALNYKHSFSLDSLPLIEALVNDITYLNSSLSRLRMQKSDPESLRELSGRIEYLNREKIKLEEEIQRGSINSIPYDERETLNKGLIDLRRENQMLSQKLLNAQTVKKDFVDEKNKEYVDKLYSDYVYMKKQFEESEENTQKLVYDNRVLQDRIRALEGQVDALRKELDVSIDTIKGISNENRSTVEEYYSLKNALSGYESKCAEYEDENNSLRNNLQKVQQHVRSLDQQLCNLNKELGKNRNELEMNSSTKSRLSSQLESLQRQVDILQNESTQLHNLRDNDKMTILDLESKYKEIEDLYRASQEKIRSFQLENQAFSESVRDKAEELRDKVEELRDKSEELRAKDQIIKNQDKDLRDLKHYIIKYEECQEEISNLKGEIDENSIEIRKYREENNNLKYTLKCKDEDIRQLKNTLDQYNREVEILKRRLDDENSKVESLNSIIKQYSQIEEQLKASRNQYEDSIYRERQLKKDIEQFQMIVQKNEEKIRYGQIQQEALQNKLMIFEQENDKMQQNILEISANDNTKAMEISRYENQIQLNYSEIDELKRKVLEKEQMVKNLSDEIRDRQKAFIAEEDHANRLNEQVIQLKNFISSLEGTRADLMKKLENYSISDIEKDNTLKNYKEELQLLKKQLQISERNANDGLIEREKNIKIINELQYENTKKNDEITSQKSNIDILNRDINDLNYKLKSILTSEDNFKRCWRDSEIEKARVTEINLAMNLQLEDNKKTISRFQSQYQDISKQLSYRDNEIRSLEERYKALIYEKDSISNRLEENNKELRIKIEISANLQKDKDELIQKLRILSEEFDKLHRSYDFLNLDYKKLIGKSAAGENLIESLKQQEDVYVKTIKQLEEDLRDASRAAEISEFKRIEAEKTSENLLKDMHSAKNINRNLDLSQNEMQRKIMMIDNEKAYLDNKCRNYDIEISNLKSQLDYEKKKSAELESRYLANKESFRRSEIEDEKMRNLRNPSSEQLISELYKQIETYKAESIKLEMNYMKLFDEYNQKKQMFSRAEARIAELEMGRR